MDVKNSKNNKQEEELYIVTEQGVFGDLDILDPSKKKATKEETARLIEESIKNNSQNLR